MGKRCAVPGCSTGEPTEVKRRKYLKEKQVPLFGVPQSPSQANAWTVAIKAETPLTQKHFVCQLHFRNDDLITYFIHTLPNGKMSTIKCDRRTLRKGAIPVLGETVEQLQSTEIVNDSNNFVAETSGSLTQRRDESPELYSSTGITEAVANASMFEPVDNYCTLQNPDDSSMSSNVQREVVEQPQLAEISEQCADTSTFKAMVNAITSEVVDDNCTLQSHDDCSERSDVDHSLYHGSDEDITDNAGVYTMEKLVIDLKESQWIEGWAWSCNVNGVVFVHLRTLTLEPRLYCLVSNDLTVTVSLADRDLQGQLDDKIRVFTDLTATLSTLQRMRECVGTGLANETYVCSHDSNVKDVKADFWRSGIGGQRN